MAVKNTDRMLDLSRDLLASGVPKYGVGGRRNLIINGAMQVAQRSISEPGISTSGFYTADRFRTGGNLGTWTQTVENDGPDGFSKSLKMLCTTPAASPTAGNFLGLGYRLEGQDLQHLKKGTSSAESVTVSFWVKSNKTGTYILEVGDDSNSNRHINKSYTVNVSGTWEYKTITFEGDTTGAFANDNTSGLALFFWLGSGSNFNTGTLQTSWDVSTTANRAVGNVNLADATSNYFQITGVQLEVGDTATPFEHRSYGEELALCQRYYQKYPVVNATTTFLSGLAITTTQVRVSIRSYGGLMRDDPSISVPTTVQVKGNGVAVTVTSVAASSAGGGGHTFNFNTTTTLNSNHVYYITGTQAAGAFELDAEL